jgi:hypothetical protein
LRAAGAGQTDGSRQGAEFQDITTVDGHGSLRGQIACRQDVQTILDSLVYFMGRPCDGTALAGTGAQQESAH